MGSAVLGSVETDAQEKVKDYSLLGETIRLTARPGVVVSEPKIWSETRVSSSGGGGYVHPQHGGHVAAPSVHSTSVERSSYFVKYGNEWEAEIRDGVACRNGNRIYGVFMARPGTNTNMLVATLNRDTSRYVRIVPWGHFFANPPCAALRKLAQNRARDLKIFVGVAIVLFALAWLFGGDVASVVDVLLIALVPMVILSWWRDWSARKQLEREFPAAVVNFLNSLS